MSDQTPNPGSGWRCYVRRGLMECTEREPHQACVTRNAAPVPSAPSGTGDEYWGCANDGTWDLESCTPDEAHPICAAWNRRNGYQRPAPPAPSSDEAGERGEVCGSTGPRIGDQEERPRCGQDLGHEGLHRGFPGSGFESEQWGAPLMRDDEFAASYRPAAPPSPVTGDAEEVLPTWGDVMAAVDRFWPEDVWNTLPEDDPEKDYGHRILSLIRRLDAAAAPAVEVEPDPLAELRKLPEWQALLATVEKTGERRGDGWMAAIGRCALDLVDRLAAADRGAPQ